MGFLIDAVTQGRFWPSGTPRWKGSGRVLLTDVVEYLAEIVVRI